MFAYRYDDRITAAELRYVVTGESEAPAPAPPQWVRITYKRTVRGRARPFETVVLAIDVDRTVARLMRSGAFDLASEDA